MMANTFLIALVLLPIFIGLIQYIIKKIEFNIWTVAFQFLLLLGTVLMLVPIGASGEIVMKLSPTSIPAGMELRVDRLSFVMLFLNNLVFFVMSFSSYHKLYYNKLFIFLFLSLQGLINGIFMSTDFFNIYLLIELATIIVSILIMYKKDGRSHYDGMIYLMVNMVGMAFFLMGVGYIYKIFGVLDFKSVGQLVEKVPKESLVLPLAFLLTGASLKSAFMPLFSWLPKAHGTASAPTILSAVLSGVFVKTGIYLIVRTINMFAPVYDLSQIFFVIAIITAFLGSLFAISQKDVKLILSYSTISQVGMIMIGLSHVSETGIAGGVYYLLNHGVFKATFFFIIGILIKSYGTKKVYKIRGLWNESKLLSMGLIVVVLTLTGFPLLGGGIGKYMIGGYFEGNASVWMFRLLSLLTWLYCIPILGMLKGNKDRYGFSMSFNQKAALITLIVTIVSLGLGYKVVLNQVFAYDLSLSMSKLVAKFLEYVLISAAAYGVCYFSESMVGVKDKLEKFDLSFNSINIAILAYFVSLSIIFNMI